MACNTCAHDSGHYPECTEASDRFVAAIEARTPAGYHWALGSFDDDDEFSWGQCDCCGTHLGGSRHEMNLIKGCGVTCEVIPCRVCQDCLLFHANGDLPETWRSR